MEIDLSNIPNEGNVLEFIILNSIDNNLFNHNHDITKFMNLLKGFSKKHKTKYFSKKYKRYKTYDLVMECSMSDIKDINIYKQNCISSQNNDNILSILYKRDKIPYHQFPSTRNLNEIVYIQRLTFRLHNRLFLNFEIKKNMDNVQFNKIYFNYNHDKASEIKTIENILNEHIKYFI